LPIILESGSLLERCGMVVQGIASVAFHSTGSPIAKMVDIHLRNIIAPTLILYEIVYFRSWKPLFFGIFAFSQYMNGIFNNTEHALLVHLPVFIGFLCLRAT